MATDLVLVSGATGFIATHVVKLLLQEGYRVRGTVRSLKDERKTKHLYHICPEAKENLELVEADLVNADSWTNAVKDCKYIQHIASPFPLANPRHEDELIRPAVDGTLNVLKAAAAAGTVKRIVLTSSVAAVTTSGEPNRTFSEADWLDPNAVKNLAYAKSKVLAERAAWDFVKDLPDDQKFELCVVNPVFVVGPALHGSVGSSTDVMTRLLERQMPAVPHLNLTVVDVRDVALAHLRCMTLDEAVGHRHIVSNVNMTLLEMAQILAAEFKSQGYNVPTKPLPGLLFTIAGWFDKTLKTAKELGSEVLSLDNSRMKNVLGITPIDASKTVIDMAYSLIDNGFVKKTAKYQGRGDQQ